MRRHVRHAITAACAFGAMAGLGLVATPANADADEYEVLVVGETLGFRHSHIDDTTNAIIALGEEHGFSVDVWDPPQGNSPGQPALTLPSTPFTSADDLSKYATIIFASPVDATNNLDPNRPRLLNDTELAAFQGYIRGGGGYVGLHAATDSMHTVPWYSELTGGGARFRNHPAQQTATMRVESPGHPSTEMLPTEWVRFDEWYNFTANPRDDVHVLITLDESTYNPGNGRMGEDHPIAWCHNFEGGRSWYEGAGHVDSSWTDPTFLAHILGGIQWTAGVVSGGGDCVTFSEVDDLVSGLEDGSQRVTRLGDDVTGYLDAAESAADAGDHAGAVDVLVQAKGKAHGLQDDALVAKIDDLIEWQQALVS
ncbi:ThuA domain-containing protein [Agromyces aurantiacus]|uniref:ThuA domain-containing protein n=1 Tax=Agromyces aurantiacus TaxID=165814 RepID=A0ABV9R9A8_9MICO|nr:ThuA domain-containing protein [Agromyces aurantiacus]MBM7505454.1 type 1 glutamine amidotransferase [Agromyces aurantiacus]